MLPTGWKRPERSREPAEKIPVNASLSKYVPVSVVPLDWPLNRTSRTPLGATSVIFTPEVAAPWTSTQASTLVVLEGAPEIVSFDVAVAPTGRLFGASVD